jgi:hypothetical protein
LLLGNETVRLVFLTRLVATASAPVTLYMVAALRPAAEQGFYFVFANLQAVAALFEVGVGTMLVQFAAHASADIGSPISHSAAADKSSESWLVLQQARRWFTAVAVAVVTVILPAGLLFFRSESARNGVVYKPAWVVATLALGLYLSLVPFLCFLEGSGQLARVQRMRLAQAVLNTVCLWTFIPTLGGLNASAIATIANLLVAYSWLHRSFPSLALSVASPLSLPPTATARRHELVSAQARTAVVWIVGFLGPQLLSPIVFRFQGAVDAGRVGLSLAAASAPLMLALAWLQGRYPEFGGLVARREFARLDAVAKRATSDAIIVCCGGIAGVVGLVVLLGVFAPTLATRFLPLTGVVALCVTSLAYLLYQAMAARLRAHREESLFWAILIGTVAIVGATVIGATRSVMASVIAYSAGVVGVLLPMAVVEFRRRHRVLHGQSRSEA